MDSSSPELMLFGQEIQRINHDLRTPLGTLSTALDLLLGTAQGDAVVDGETRRLMERQVKRLGELVNELQLVADELARRGM